MNIDLDATAPAQDAPPHEVVRQAAEHLAIDKTAPWHDSLCELLAEIADDMSDEDAVVREFPTHIPAKRLLIVANTYGREETRYDWTAAWHLATEILGERVVTS